VPLQHEAANRTYRPAALIGATVRATLKSADAGLLAGIPLRAI